MSLSTADHWAPFCGQCCHEVASCLCVTLSGCLQGQGDQRMILSLRDNLAQKALNIMQKVSLCRFVLTLTLFTNF